MWAAGCPERGRRTEGESAWREEGELVKAPIVHRWEPFGKTSCGRPVERVATNVGRVLSKGVTCKACGRAASRVSILGDRWNGESYGHPRAKEEEAP